ncbi:MAG: hypothetical protein ABIJ56_24605 [Pseudomonadota bacterium]
MKEKFSNPAIILAAFLMSSCGSDTGLSGDGSTDSSADRDAAEEEAAADALPDPEPDPDPDLSDVDEVEGPGPDITFILGFITDIPGYEYLYAQTSDYSCVLTWITLRDGSSRIPMLSDCAICACDVCDTCAVCGACMTSAAQVDSGGDVRFEWDGVVHARDTCDSGGVDMPCETETALDPGTYTARFCWGIADENGFPDNVIPDPRCEDITFDYPVHGGTITHVVNNSG